MPESITLTFTQGQWRPQIRDGHDFELHFEIVPAAAIGLPDEGTKTHRGSIIVGISGSLVTIWGLPDRQSIEKILFEYGKRQVIELIKEGTQPNKLDLQLTTYSEPAECPFTPEKIILEYNSPIYLKLPDEHVVLMAGNTRNLAREIISLRDSINSIFGEKYGNQLLTLPQERHLVEMFMECDTREEFAFRAASLAGLATAVDIISLREFIQSAGETVNSDAKSIQILGVYLRLCFSEEPDQVDIVMDTISNLNRIRRMYPIHTDRATGVHSAFSYFGIDYPISDYQESWTKLLEHYKVALVILLDLLKKATAQ